MAAAAAAAAGPSVGLLLLLWHMTARACHCGRGAALERAFDFQDARVCGGVGEGEGEGGGLHHSALLLKRNRAVVIIMSRPSLFLLLLVLTPGCGRRFTRVCARGFPRVLPQVRNYVLAAEGLFGAAHNMTFLFAPLSGETAKQV